MSCHGVEICNESRLIFMVQNARLLYLNVPILTRIDLTRKSPAFSITQMRESSDTDPENDIFKIIQSCDLVASLLATQDERMIFGRESPHRIVQTHRN